LSLTSGRTSFRSKRPNVGDARRIQSKGESNASPRRMEGIFGREAFRVGGAAWPSPMQQQHGFRGGFPPRPQIFLLVHKAVISKSAPLDASFEVCR
jgi:hypothetical protein